MQGGKDRDFRREIENRTRIKKAEMQGKSALKIYVVSIPIIHLNPSPNEQDAEYCEDIQI